MYTELQPYTNEIATKVEKCIAEILLTLEVAKREYRKKNKISAGVNINEHQDIDIEITKKCAEYHLPENYIRKVLGKFDGQSFHKALCEVKTNQRGLW